MCHEHRPSITRVLHSGRCLWDLQKLFMSQTSKRSCFICSTERCSVTRNSGWHHLPLFWKIELWCYERNEVLYVTSDQARACDITTDELFDTFKPRGQKMGKCNEGIISCSCLFSYSVSV